MKEYFSSCHMSEVSYENLKPQNSSTKMHVVFDPSSQTSTGISLNDTLRFNYNHAVISLKQIFVVCRHFVVDGRDRGFQRILRRNNVNES